VLPVPYGGPWFGVLVIDRSVLPAVIVVEAVDVFGVVGSVEVVVTFAGVAQAARSHARTPACVRRFGNVHLRSPGLGHSSLGTLSTPRT